MSFPRAKIQRFNEKRACSPSPADYNLRVQSNACGAVISKSERFAEPKTPVCLFNTPRVPCFRTPTLPKKKKIVECNNKDQSIRDLSEQIEEMKQQLSNLIRQTQDVSNERNRFQNDLAELKEEHRIVLQKVYLEHDVEVEELRKKMRKLEVEVLEREEELRLKKIDFAEVVNGLQSEAESAKIGGEERLKEVLTVVDELREQLRLKESEKQECEDRYVQLLGHQNHKQKIKHLMDLKSQNFTLNETNTEMEVRVRAQARTIDRLKKELAALSSSPRKWKIQDKENLNSPNRTVNGILSSPGLSERK